MPYCHECGKEIQNDWISCPYCNAKIHSATSKINVEDSIIMGNVSETTNIHLAEKKDIHNHMLTMIDALYEGRDERAREIFEIAKKINYPFATQLHDVEYKDQIIDSKVVSLIRDWKNNIKGNASKDGTVVDILKPLILAAIETANSIIHERPEALEAYIVLGEIGIEYRKYLFTYRKDGQNIAVWASKQLRSHGFVDDANRISSIYESCRRSDKQELYVLGSLCAVAVFVLGMMIW